MNNYRLWGRCVVWTLYMTDLIHLYWRNKILTSAKEATVTPINLQQLCATERNVYLQLRTSSAMLSIYVKHSEWPFRLCHKNFVCGFHFSHKFYVSIMPSFWLGHPNNILRRVQILKLLILQITPSCCCIRLRCKCSSQNNTLERNSSVDVISLMLKE